MARATSRRVWWVRLAAAVAAGTVLGVLGRVAMRFVAFESGLDTGFSAGGSLEVVAFGALVGTPAALAFLIVRPQIPVARGWAGVVHGLALFTVLVVVPPPAARSALEGTPDTSATAALAFAVVFAAWGLGLDLMERHLPRHRRGT